MTVTLFHTAEVHRSTFDALRDTIAPGLYLEHVVRVDWLDQAQGGMTPDLESEIVSAIQAVKGPVLCTCTTLGPTAEQAGAIRVDWPMMHAAAKAGGPIVMAYCLDSTWRPSLALLERALAEADSPAKVHPLFLGQYWPLFMADETEAFSVVIAGEIRQAVAVLDEVGCVVLAQASMAGAAPLLADLDVQVLASPELALRAVLHAT